ncbi:MAG: prephenate dehydrogenase/arogenate dehydrogenase family protein [Bacteroidota bacterium]
MSPADQRATNAMTTSPFQRITIIGVGLIGGSLGLAVKRKFPDVWVTGYDKPGVLQRAIKRGAIDSSAWSIESALAAPDLVILATPLAATLELLPAIGRRVSARVVVTDVGSVKSTIVQRSRSCFPHRNFIGGHPMAGVELSGIEAAHPLLFENAVYVLTPPPKTPHHALHRLSHFLHLLGARVLVLDASTHDSVASAVSHLPQLAAVAMMNTVGKKHRGSGANLQLAAGGFRDLTRIASSRFDVWQDVLEFNRKNIVHALDLYIGELLRYKLLVAKGGSKLRKDFVQSRLLRSRIPKSMKGFLHPLSEVLVFLEDRPGTLALLTTTLGKAKLNIKDMELVKVREGTGGTFRLSFGTREEAEKAAKLLKKKGFSPS